MTTIKGMVAAAAIAAVGWPAAAEAAKLCSLRSILGTWTIELVTSEQISEFPADHGGPIGDVWEETRHLRCHDVVLERIEKDQKGRERVRGIVKLAEGCESHGPPDLTQPGPERQSFLLYRKEGAACRWRMVSETVQGDSWPAYSGVIGTRGGVNIVQFSHDGDTLVGSGSFAIGIGDTGEGPVGSAWPSWRPFPTDGGNVGQAFAVTLFGVKQ